MRIARLLLVSIALLIASGAGCGGGDDGSAGSIPADLFDDVGRVPAMVPSPTGVSTTAVTSSPTTTSLATTNATDVTDPTNATDVTDPTNATDVTDPTNATDVTDPTASETTTTIPERVEAGAVADSVDGNRVLVIGDSLMASTAPRNEGAMCAVLGGRGWSVELAAETGQHVEFGVEVLDERLEADEWDAVVVMLGNNYRNDPGHFAEQMATIVDLIAPRPTILFTVTEFEPSRAEVNDIIRFIAGDRSNVVVADWAAETASPDSPLLTDDGLHLSDAGRLRLAAVVGDTLGDAPSPSTQGICLDSPFEDDSGATIPPSD
ncbi:MAG: GDSL-type esterase/lipase family protein [Ilumatobacteraceae bacterium]